MQSLSPDRKKYVTSIWRIDTARRPAGPAHPVRRRRGQPAVPARRHAAVRLQANRPRRGRRRGERVTKPGAVAAARPRRRGQPGHQPAGRRRGGGNGSRRARDPAVRPGPAGRRGRGREAAAGAQGRRGLRDLARDRCRCATGITTSAPTTRACSPTEVGTRRTRAARPYPGRRPGAVRAGGRAQPGRHDGRDPAGGSGGTGCRRTRNWSPIDVASGSRTVLSADGRVRLRRPGLRPRRASGSPACAAQPRDPGTARRRAPWRYVPGGTDLLPGFDRWPSEPGPGTRRAPPSTSPPMTTAAGRCSRSTSPAVRSAG